MILITGTVRIPKGTIDRARPAMAAMIVDSKAEEGCLHYAYAEDVLDGGLIHVTEKWTDRDALAAHFKSPHLLRWREQFAALGITDRDLTMFETGDGEPV